MRKIAIFGAAAALILATAAPVMAQSRSHEREWRQSERIYRGAVRGKLTPNELRRLAQQQRRIDRAQDRAYADGYVSRSEARRIERMQDRASRNIWRKKSNARHLY